MKGFLGKKRFVCSVLVCPPMLTSMLCVFSLYVLLYSLVVETSRQCDYVSKFILFMYLYYTLYLYFLYPTRYVMQFTCPLNTVCSRACHTSHLPTEAHKTNHTSIHCNREAATSSVYTATRQRLRYVQVPLIISMTNHYKTERRG